MNGTWPRAYQQTVSYSNGAQAGVWMWFNGSTITRRYTMAFNRGNRTVYIDGANIETISDNAATTRWQVQRTWAVANGLHFIEVRGQGGNFSDLDAFIVNIPTVGAGMYDDPHGQFQYIGAWTHSTGWPPFPNGPHNGTVSWTNTSEDAVSFTFTGRRIRYYFTRGANRGIAAITIDGVHHEDVNACSGATVWRDNNTYPREGRLPDGVHTIHISNTGQTTCGDGSIDFRYIDVDALEPLNN
jgi:hypothetical protein